MLDPDDGAGQQSTESVQGGPSRPPLFEKIPVSWRRTAITVGALVVGATAGATAAHRWQDEPPPPAFTFDEHAVELLLFDAVLPQDVNRGRGADAAALRVASAVFLSGAQSSTVTTINNPGGGLDVRAVGLPVQVSTAARFQPVDLVITVRDCEAATHWTPVDRPFRIAWRDDEGLEHVDRGGDFDRTIARSLVDYVELACGNRGSGTVSQNGGERRLVG